MLDDTSLTHFFKHLHSDWKSGKQSGEGGVASERTLGWCVTSSCLLSVAFPKWLNYRVLFGDLYSA